MPSLALACRLSAVSRASRRPFSPASLFSSGEQGVWYDPSDISTLYQDSAGTTPVTAVEQPVGMMLDKSKGLVLGSESLSNGDFSGGSTGWTVGSGWVVSGGAASGSSIGALLTQPGVLTTGKWYRATVVISGWSGAYALTVGQAGNPAWILTNYAAGTYTGYFNSGTSTDFVLRVATGNAVPGTITVDSVSVRELPGNHAYQSTTTSRPTLSARVNMLTYTEQFDNAAWFKIDSSVTANATTAPDGTLTADKLIPAAASVIGRTQQNYTGSAGTTYTLSVYAKQGEFSALRLYSDDNASNIASVSFNLISGAIITGPSVSGTWTGVSATSTPINAGWYRFTLTWTATGAAPVRVQFWNPDTGDGTSGIYIWGADLRPTNSGVNLPPYQRVGASTDYDTAGFPAYLKFDGTDDGMATGSIDFTATDKMSVFAGVRKLVDSATSGVIAETSVDAGGNNGAFILYAHDTGKWKGLLRGTATIYGPVSGTFNAPITNVLTQMLDIGQSTAANELRMRVNGADQTITFTGGDAGTGNYGNYPLYIGRRGGTTLPFNGRIYSLIVCGKLASAAEIASTENWVNGKTKAF